MPSLGEKTIGVGPQGLGLVRGDQSSIVPKAKYTGQLTSTVKKKKKDRQSKW